MSPGTSTTGRKEEQIPPGIETMKSGFPCELFVCRKEEQIPPGIETIALRQFDFQLDLSQRGTNPAWD